MTNFGQSNFGQSIFGQSVCGQYVCFSGVAVVVVICGCCCVVGDGVWCWCLLLWLLWLLLFFLEPPIKQSPQSNNTAENTTSPHDPSEMNKLRTHVSNSARFGGPSSPSGVTEQEVTKELANALPQDSASILDQRRRQAKNEDRRSIGGPVPGLLPEN